MAVEIVDWLTMTEAATILSADKERKSIDQPLPRSFRRIRLKVGARVHGSSAGCEIKNPYVGADAQFVDFKQKQDR